MTRQPSRSSCHPSGNTPATQEASSARLSQLTRGMKASMRCKHDSASPRPAARGIHQRYRHRAQHDTIESAAVLAGRPGRAGRKPRIRALPDDRHRSPLVEMSTGPGRRPVKNLMVVQLAMITTAALVRQHLHMRAEAHRPPQDHELRLLYQCGLQVGAWCRPGDERVLVSCTLAWRRGRTGSVKWRRGALAQLVERLHGMQEVRGSNPLSSTVFRTSVRTKVTNIVTTLRRCRRRRP
jgi:hypothetical protein